MLRSRGRIHWLVLERTLLIDGLIHEARLGRQPLELATQKVGHVGLDHSDDSVALHTAEFVFIMHFARMAQCVVKQECIRWQHEQPL